MDRAGRILLVDNSRAYSAIVAGTLSERLGFSVILADSLDGARKALESGDDGIMLVLSGLVLPDADERQVVDFFVGRGLPLVVVSGVFDTGIRERILARPVIDYVLKDNPASVDYLAWLVERIARNRDLTALVVDDSRSYRMQISSLLRLYGFSVLEADDGARGLELIRDNPHIRLAVIDYQLPGLDGIHLVRRIRAIHPRDRLAIIGISSSQSSRGPISAQFIKSGANDYLNKPFLPEELFCRVSQNVESLESIAALRTLATTDYLTGLSNRRSFFEIGPRRLETLVQQGEGMSVAMIDIDFFKRINDGHGHECGDAVLVEVARILAASVRAGDLVARFGGEEFCILAAGLAGDAAMAFFEGIRAAVEAAAIVFNGAHIPVTISVGLCPVAQDSLGVMLAQADAALYRAKQSGRNKVERA
ncbi:diguanylate cyclase [Magnetospirillum sp. SS-4]|uniref:diguanylate cyclase n=1 Tax=Magnetospirillum sp. SS-4 TaxID=2681465 RepID=UPI00137E53B4|nr:diguanylate cyclase [Magnetospirillum sp. SS-4]CAA7624877.1 putative two-component response transcriptional regulator, GGDEF domain [Magnetospirillum sp. SS-4]